MLTLLCLLVLQDSLNDQDKLLMDAPKGWSYLQISPDGRRAACLVRLEGLQSILVHPQGRSEGFDDAGIPVFGPRSGRLGCMLRKGKLAYALMDGKTIGPVDGAYTPGILFSPDEAHWAFMTRNDATRKEAVYLDGEKIDEFELLESFPNLLFTPDGKLAYRGVRIENGRARHHVIVDGKTASPGYESIGILRQSPDGRRLAFEARRGDRSFVVLDGAEQKSYELVFGLTFSPDSRRFAYMGTGTAVIDGKETAPGRFMDHFTFSSDSKRVAYVLEGLDGWRHAVEDGKVGPPFENAYDLRFSDDSKRFAYSIQDGHDRRAVIDGKKGRAFTWTEPVLFTPDSLHAVYLARDGKQTHLAVDGRILRTFGHAAGLRILPDGKRVGLGVVEGEKIWWRIFPIE